MYLNLSKLRATKIKMKRFNTIVATFGVVAHAVSLEVKLESENKAMTDSKLENKSGQHYTIVS